MLKKAITTTILSALLIGALLSQPGKTILLEEGTGTWCAWCPEGKVVSERLLLDYPDDVIVIEVHGNDVMTNTDYQEESQYPFYPSGHLNRKRRNLSPDQWELALVAELNTAAFANVSITNDYDPISRQLTVNTSAQFFEDLSGDYRFAAIVVEDAITSSTEEYIQANIYADNAHGPMGGFEILPNDVPASLMIYDHIGRHLLGGYHGEQGSLPYQIEAEKEYSHTFEWTIPEEYNTEYVWVTAVLINHETGDILNAKKSTYLNGKANAKPFFASHPNVDGHRGYAYEYAVRYHDSDHHSYQLEIIDPLPSWLTFEKGRKGFAKLKGTPNEKGTYPVTLRLSDLEYTIDQTFDIIVQDSVPPLVTSLENDFLILPNPNSGIFRLEYDKGFLYQVHNPIGKEVTKGILYRDTDDGRYSQPIQIDHLDAGVYYLNLSDRDSYVRTHKMIIAK